MHPRLFWPAVAASVLAIDLYAITRGHDSLSQQHRNAASSKWWPVIALGHAYLVAHLYDVLPASWDPLSRCSQAIRERVR